MDTNATAIRTRTTLGTLCAKSWDSAWIERVNERESTLNRPICGARTRSDTPCTMSPNHQNGRCKFHGGFSLTVARKGYRRAALHLLYSRGFQLRREQCPLLDACPMAGNAAGEVFPEERADCPYEEAEYSATLTDLMRRIDLGISLDSSLIHLAHQVALMQAMTSRAAAALRSRPITETSTSSIEEYFAESTRVSASVQTFTLIADEFRRFCDMIDV